jgi:DNA-binding NtrC family response regulator
MMPGKVLIVDDDQAMCEMLNSDLRRRGFTPTWYTRSEKALDSIHQEEYDVILADINMPGMTGIQLCERIALNRPDIPVIVITAFGSLEVAVSAIRAGAYDFVTKPVDTDILELALSRAISHHALQERVKTLCKEVEKIHSIDEIIGQSQTMQSLFSQIRRLTATDVSVLVLGESGTGKELVARALHRQSGRRNGPFVPINCSALPETLLESELFGHKRGAFTDAREDRPGLFLEAQGGTLFLDEIGEIPVNLQPKILRALEERRVRPVGGNREVLFDVRIIAATNRDLESAIEKKLFREDLFYRINVVQLEVPPLRARGTDILLLAHHFVRHFADHTGRGVSGISDAAAEKLLAYSWPGNVRELRNAIERAVTLTRFENLAVEDFPEKIRTYQSDQLVLGTHDPSELVSMEEIERRYILHVLKTVQDNRTLAARILKLDRKTLYRKLQQYKIDPVE